MVQLKCGDHFFPCSITVLDQARAVCDQPRLPPLGSPLCPLSSSASVPVPRKRRLRGPHGWLYKHLCPTMRTLRMPSVSRFTEGFSGTASEQLFALDLFCEAFRIELQLDLDPATRLRLQDGMEFLFGLENLKRHQVHACPPVFLPAFAGRPAHLSGLAGRQACC